MNTSRKEHSARNAVADLRVEVWDQMDPFVAEWEQLARSTNASPFLWPGWISTWWRVLGAGRLKILTVYEENGDLVGVLPLRRFRGVLSSTTGWNTPLFGFLASNDAAVERLSSALFSQRPRRVDLSFLSASDPGVSLVRASADAARYRVHMESLRAAPYVAIDGDWDAYEAKLRRKFRSEIRRRRRRLEERGRLTLDVSDGKEKLDELLEEGFRVEGLGWKDAYGTSINSRPTARRFYTEVAHWASERGWLRLAFLRLDGRVLAFDYCLEYNKVHYLLKTGYDPAYGKFGPGMIIRHMMLARAFSERLNTYNFLGVGSDDVWKREWTNSHQERLFLRMFAPTLSGSLDQATFICGRAALEGFKSIARSPIVGERGRRLLKRVHAMMQASIARR